MDIDLEGACSTAQFAILVCEHWVLEDAEIMISTIGYDGARRYYLCYDLCYSRRLKTLRDYLLVAALLETWGQPVVLSLPLPWVP